MNPFDITPDELRRIRQTLRKRFVNRTYPQVIDVRLGTAILQSSGRSDPKRDWAVIFHVRKKLAQPKATERIPKHLDIRFRRGSTFFTVQLPTDVVELSSLTPTGSEIWYSRGGSQPTVPASAGALLSWTVPSPIGPLAYHGLLSVGHPTGAGDEFGPIAVRSGGVVSHGQLKARTLNGLDASVASVDRSQLAGLPNTLSSLRPRGVIDHDHGRSGRSLRPGGSVRFSVLGPPQDQNLGGVWGFQQAIVWVEASASGAFQPGTSGSVWEIQDASGQFQAALIQLGAESPGFRIGVGQVIHQTSLSWAFEAIGILPGVMPGSVSFVGAF